MLRRIRKWSACLTDRTSNYLVWIVVIIGMHAIDCAADEPFGSPQIASGDRQAVIVDMLQQYCVECHSADNQEADVRVDTLDLDRAQADRGETLEKILNAVSQGNMPPEDAESPTAAERAILIRGLETLLSTLPDQASRVGHWTGNRRLSVEEYNFTMQALFAVDAEFADMLPADPLSGAGYRNDRERLGLSSLQIEAYLDSARRAVDRYVQFDEFNDPPLRYHIELEDLFYATDDRYGTRKNAPQPMDPDVFAARQAASFDSPPKYVDPLGPRLPGAFSDDETLRAAIPKLNQQYVAIPLRLPVGEMTLRIRAAGTPDRGGRFPRMRVEAGITLGDGCSIDKRLLGEFDVTASIHEPTVYELRMRLEDVPTKGPLRDEESFDRLSVFDMDQVFISNVSTDEQAIFDRGRGGYSDPDTGAKEIAKPLKQMADGGTNFLFLDSLQIEMVPGGDANNRPYRWQVPTAESPVEPLQEIVIARELLLRFMREAYRRPIAPIEVDTKLQLFEDLRRSEYSFEDSLKETLAAVLVSPSFLFLESSPPVSIATEPITDDLDADPADSIMPHELASRLSYLLWLSPPDEPLSKRADDESLLERDVLLSEAKRMLADPRSRRFMESFCRQWLRLDKLPIVAVDRQRYPTYDEDLADLSVRETLDFFIEVFTTDSSVLDLIDSNYAMLNDRLAEHYSIDVGDLFEGGSREAIGGRLRRIPLPRDSVRGGLLTQASVLTMNSDGVDSHPIRRGAWLLDRMLNQPPPPPPPNVPILDANDPDFRGLTLKQRIELHRQPGECQNCHAKIDPWGIPFENFDAMGRWRNQIEPQDDGDQRRQAVDASALLPGGQSISGITELKSYLRQQRGEEFANAFVHHLLTYAMGHSPGYHERQAVNEIQQRFAAANYRVKGLMLAIIDSPLFRPAAQ